MASSEVKVAGDSGGSQRWHRRKFKATAMAEVCNGTGCKENDGFGGVLGGVC